jgi:ribosomal protein S18 acetylase RimI-like enzyme
VEKSCQGRGLGSLLMKMLFAIGLALDLPKCMLTVFKINQSAIKFYSHKLGFSIDEISPDPEKGNENYLILSREEQKISILNSHQNEMNFS